MFYFLRIHSPSLQSSLIPAHPLRFGSLMYRRSLGSARILQGGVSKSGTSRQLDSWARTSRYCRSVYPPSEWKIYAFEADKGSYGPFRIRHIWSLVVAWATVPQISSRYAIRSLAELPIPLHLFLGRGNGCSVSSTSRALRKVACIHHIGSCV